MLLGEEEEEEEKDAFFHVIRHCWKAVQSVEGMASEDLLNSLQMELTFTEEKEVVGKMPELLPGWTLSIIPAEGATRACEEIYEEFREAHLRHLSRLDTLSRNLFMQLTETMKKQVRQMFPNEESEPEINFKIDFSLERMFIKCCNYPVVDNELEFP